MEKIDEINNTNGSELTIVNVEKNNDTEIKQKRYICKGILYILGTIAMGVNAYFIMKASQTSNYDSIEKIMGYVTQIIDGGIMYTWLENAAKAFAPKYNNTSKEEEIEEELNERVK